MCDAAALAAHRIDAALAHGTDAISSCGLHGWEWYPATWWLVTRGETGRGRGELSANTARPAPGGCGVSVCDVSAYSAWPPLSRAWYSSSSPWSS